MNTENRYTAYWKVSRVIDSCTTMQHIRVASRLIHRVVALFPDAPRVGLWGALNSVSVELRLKLRDRMFEIDPEYAKWREQRGQTEKKP
jgi:hypothetical protein